MARRLSPRTLSVSMIGGAVVASTLAQAATDSEAIEARLRALESQVSKLRPLEAEIAKLRREARKAKEQAGEAQAAAANVVNAGAASGSPAPPPVFVSFKNGLYAETADKAYSFKIGGRMQFDGGAATQPLNGWSGQAGVRQVRLEVEGKAAKYWFYKLQYDFAGGQYGAPLNAPVQGGIRDFYIAFQHPALSLPFTKDPAFIHVGSYFEPFSLEFTASSRFRDFIERAMAVEAFAPSRHLGAAIGAYGDNWSAKGGIFTTSFEDLNTNPALATSAPFGLPARSGWVATGGGQYFDLTGRLTYAPIKDEHDLLHVGVSGRFHQPNSATGLSDDRVLRLGNRIRSENYILNQGLLGTPDLSCGTVAFPGVATAASGHCVNNVEAFGVELSAAHGPFSLQAEYLGQRVNRNETNIALSRLAGAFAPGGASHYFSGYYVYGQWYVTGEERAAAYNVSDKIGANFTQIKIKHPLSEGGVGALGLAARFSALDLNSGPYSGTGLSNMLAYTTLIAPNPAAASAIANAGVVGGRQENATLGLNWYPDNGFHFQLNWTHVLHASAPLNDYFLFASGVPARQGAFINGAHSNLFEARAQVYW
ncbi:porin [Methylocystis echinoides]|uniref:OprO/OprP family phosphate-selective porin n=1 Tax=Methylocystis echinoides TaxID=29468 RepID=UPI00342A3041